MNVYFEAIKELKDQKDWIREIATLISLIEQLEELNKATSVRELSKMLDRSKSWVGQSLVLARGIVVYPELKKFSNRNRAYIFLQHKGFR